MCEQMPPKKDNEDLNAPMNALNLKDPGSDDEAGAPDPALVPDPAGEDELSVALRELSVAEQALFKAQTKVYNLSMLHINAMEQIIIDGAEQVYSRVWRPPQSEPRLVIIGRRTTYCEASHCRKGVLIPCIRNILLKRGACEAH